MVVRFLAARKNDKPVAGIRAGTVAIWDAGVSGTDYAPAISPAAHLDKIRFHSDFDYLRVRSVVTSRDPGRSAISLPFLDIYANESDQYTLFAHGLGYIPLIVAEIENNSYHQPAAGSVFVMQTGMGGADWRCRHLIFWADATNVYLYARGARAPATTLHWKVFLLEESFQVTTTPSRMLRFEAGAATVGQLGKIDPTYRFARKAAGASGDMRVLGRQSIVLDTQSGRTTFNYCDGSLSMAVPTVHNSPDPTPSLSFSGIECDVLAASPDGVSAGFRAGSTGVTIRDNAGNVVFNSEWQMLAVLAHYSGTVTTSIHSPSGTQTTRGQTDTDLGAAPSATQALIGWLQFGTDGKYYDFGGTIINAFGLYRRDASWAVVIPYGQFFSAFVAGGRAVLRDDWFSVADDTGAFQGAPKVTWPAQTLNYDLRAVALVGGA